MDEQFLKECEAFDVANATRDELLRFDERWCLGLHECNTPAEIAAVPTRELRYFVDAMLDRAADEINSRY